MLGGGGIVGGVNLDCVLTSAGESGMVECFPVRSEEKQRKKRLFIHTLYQHFCVLNCVLIYIRAERVYWVN